MDLKTKKPIVKWCLESTSDPKNRWVFPVDQVPFTIGRDQDCSLKLRSKAVSRHHARLNVSGDMLWIRDSGSTNGTFLNDEKATRQKLKHNDVIRVGWVSFKFIDESKADPSKTAKIHKSWIPGVFYTKQGS